MNWQLRFFVGFALIGLMGFSNGWAQHHEHLQTFQDDKLKQIVNLASSADGRHLYSANMRPGNVTLFKCDPETGAFEKAQAVLKYSVLGLDMNSNQDLIVVCSSYDQGKVILYRRNQENGRVREVHEIYRQVIAAISRPIDVRFSPDGQYVYVACQTKTFVVLRVVNDRLELHQMIEDGIDECIDRSQTVVCDPTGKFVFLSNRGTGTISVFARGADGQLTQRGYLKDDSLQAALLKGIHGLTVSPDGKHLYATSGRFGGDHGVSCFQINDDATLSKVCELENGIELENFRGGHHVKVSLDGLYVYATGATSKNIACFRREPESGRLTFLEYLSADSSTEFGLVSGISFSPNGKFVYVANEGKGEIMAFRRPTQTSD
jgi:6-phosphogluconolactonase (cycloisomerase 2 family)